MSPVEAIAKQVGDIAAPALRSFVWSFLLMVLLGAILTIPSFVIAAKHHVWWGVLAALVPLVASVAVGWPLATKRGTATGLRAAVERYQVGSQTVHAIFARIPKVSDAPATESLLPIAEAERLLRNALRDILSAPAGGSGISGWIKRKLQHSLHEKTGQIALTHLHAQEGSVDLMKLRDIVAGEADAALTKKLKGSTGVALLHAGLVVLIAIGCAVLIRVLSAL